MWPEHPNCAGLKMAIRVQQGCNERGHVKVVTQRLLCGDEVDEGSLQVAAHKAYAREGPSNLVGLDDSIQIIPWGRALDRATSHESLTKRHIVASRELLSKPLFERVREPSRRLHEGRSERSRGIQEWGNLLLDHVSANRLWVWREARNR